MACQGSIALIIQSLTVAKIAGDDLCANGGRRKKNGQEATFYVCPVLIVRSLGRYVPRAYKSELGQIGIWFAVCV